MKTTIYSVICMLLLIYSCDKHSEQQPEYTIPDSLDLYLLLGQSNMEGEAPIEEKDYEPIKGVWILDTEGNIVPSDGIINRYSTIRFQGTPKYGLGASFGRSMYESLGKDILLISNARGGTNIAQWTKGSGFEYYEEAVRRVKVALEHDGVTLRGILWHQGEGDSGLSKLEEYYYDKLTSIVADFRDDLKAPQLPFIAGEIGYLFPNANAFNSIIFRIEDYIPHSDYVSAEKCSLQGDNTHFTRSGYDLLGSRYAEKALELCY